MPLCQSGCDVPTCSRMKEEYLTEEETESLLKALFPQGLGGADVQTVLCPEGWSASPLRIALHPTPEQQYDELVRMRAGMENLSQLFKKREPAEGDPALPEPKPVEPLPDRETFLTEAREEADEQSASDAQEIGRLVGQCTWDILSNNHDLLRPDGSVKHIGSFRHVAQVVAEFYYQKKRQSMEEIMEGMKKMAEIKDPMAQIEFMRSSGAIDMSYCEFYMGTQMIAHRADLTAIYVLIFERLKALDHAWQYSFPRLDVVRMGKPEAEADDPPEWEGYDPSGAFGKEQEEAEKEAEYQKMKEDLAAAYRESVEAARQQPVPRVVEAYRAVFDHYPAGWPPWDDLEK
jgi:hypothetical protein